MKFVRETRRFSFEISAKRGEQVQLKRTLPEQEVIDAFVLTFRFFIQNNEKCSFGNLNKLYQNLPISQVMKNEFFKARERLNEYLDSKIRMTIYSETPTRRRLVDVFVYGGLAHATPEKKQVYDKWKMFDTVYGMIEVEFCSSLEMILRIIRYVVNLNLRVLVELS
jgi:hypothetical protein